MNDQTTTTSQATRFYLVSKTLVFGHYASEEAARQDAIEVGYDASDFLVIEAPSKREARRCGAAR